MNTFDSHPLQQPAENKSPCEDNVSYFSFPTYLYTMQYFAFQLGMSEHIYNISMCVAYF